MNPLEVAPADDGWDQAPERGPSERPERFVSDHLKADPRAYLVTNVPLICLEYNGDEFEEVVNYIPEGCYWVWETLAESGWDPIIEFQYRHGPDARFYRDVTEGYTPGYRIWCLCDAHGVQSWGDCGTEYDVDWEIDVLWEDRPEWLSQASYMIQYCLDMGGVEL